MLLCFLGADWKAECGLSTLFSLPPGWAEIVGFVQPEEEKALGRPYCGLSTYKRGL